MARQPNAIYTDITADQVDQFLASAEINRTLTCGILSGWDPVVRYCLGCVQVVRLLWRSCLAQFSSDTSTKKVVDSSGL